MFRYYVICINFYNIFFCSICILRLYLTILYRIKYWNFLHAIFILKFVITIKFVVINIINISLRNFNCINFFTFLANRLIIRHFIHQKLPVISTKNGMMNRQTNRIMNRGMNRRMDRRMDRIVNRITYRQGNHGRTTYLKVIQNLTMTEK